MKTERDRYLLASERVLIRLLRRLLKKQAQKPDEQSLNRSLFLTINALLQKSQVGVPASSAVILEQQDAYARND
jgi:hypothetical protein